MLTLIKSGSSYINFRYSKVIKDIDGYSLMRTESVLQEDIIILNVCAPNNRMSKYMKQTLIKQQGEIG